MRIDFFFLESEGGGTEFYPIKYMCIMKQKKRKRKRKRSYQIYEYNEIEKKNDRVKYPWRGKENLQLSL